MNADLPIERGVTTAKRSKRKLNLAAKKAKNIDIDEQKINALHKLEHKQEVLKTMSNLKRAKAIQAIQKGSQ